MTWKDKLLKIPTHNVHFYTMVLKKYSLKNHPTQIVLYAVNKTQQFVSWRLFSVFMIDYMYKSISYLNLSRRCQGYRNLLFHTGIIIGIVEETASIYVTVPVKSQEI